MSLSRGIFNFIDTLAMLSPADTTYTPSAAALPPVLLLAPALLPPPCVVADAVPPLGAAGPEAA